MALPEAINCLRQSLQRESRPSERIRSLRPLVRILIQLGERSEARKSQDEICQNLSLLTSEDHINAARLLRTSKRRAAMCEATGSLAEMCDV